MSSYTQDNRLLRITTPLGKDKLLLKSVRGAERISTLFEYEARLLSEDNDIDYKQILGKDVTITIDSPITDGGTRYINGIVRSFGRTGSAGVLTD
jgi:type VI secretion system secreted protein VgrG